MNLLIKKKFNWLVTGVAGFIGSNILYKLLEFDQKVVGIDNLSTGNLNNFSYIKNRISEKKWKKFTFYKEDLNFFNFSKLKNKKIDYVLHQAARGSVSRSIKDPISTNNHNINAFLKTLNAAKDLKVKNFVYASSSSVYGDNPKLPKKESYTGNLLSNYALTKKVNEMYADVFYKQYKFKSVGLRYFNVFGPFQNPNGDYAAVIPKWINNVIKKKKIIIFGDGKTSRDFTPVKNAVEANIFAALSSLKHGNYIFNVANNQRTSLNKLINLIYKYFKVNQKNQTILKQDFRKGDIRHSLANINLIKEKLKYKPIITFEEGLKDTIEWFLNQNVK